MNLRDAKYLTRYKNDVIIFVSPTKLLDRFEMDSPSYSIRGGKNQIGNRVQRAKEYILKNWNNPERKKNFKNWLYQIFQPSVCGIYNGCLSFSDGRHRVLAAEELGIPEVAIEIPKGQEELFDYMKVKTMNESQESISVSVNEFMELFELFLKLKEKNKWIYIDGFKMYVRKSKRFYNKEFIDFIDLATIESDNQGTGLFTLILKEILDKYKDRNFYVENVMTDRFLNFFKKFGFIDYPLYDRCLIKISDQKKMNESPDYIDKYKNFYQNSDALPIIAWLNEDGVYVGIGKYGCSHSSVKKPSNLGFKYSIEYSGRLFTYNKVMSFWKYPDKETFIEIINRLEKKLKKKLWNNDWKIEILLVDNKISIDFNFDDLSYYDIKNLKNEIIPIEDYLKSEDIPDEERNIHMMSWAEKDSLRKAGKDPLKYYKSLGKEKPLAYKQAIYQENTSYEDVVSKFKKDILYPLKREALKFDNFKDFSTSYSVYGNHGLYFHLTNNPNWKYNSEIGSRDMSSMSDGSSQKGSFMVTSDMEGWDWYYNFDEDDKPRTSHTRDYVALIDLGDVKYHIGFGRGFGHEIYIWPNEAKKAILLDVLPIEEARKFYKKWKKLQPESEESLLKLWKSVHKMESIITKFDDFEKII